jgi:hypothetical protein
MRPADPAQDLANIVIGLVTLFEVEQSGDMGKVAGAVPTSVGLQQFRVPVQKKTKSHAKLSALAAPLTLQVVALSARRGANFKIDDWSGGW